MKRVIGMTLALLTVLVAVVAAGCNNSAASEEKAARRVAEQFYRNWFLDGDSGVAWDLSAPGLWGHFPSSSTREAFVQYQKDVMASPTAVRPLPMNAPLQIKEMDRAGDYLYLISDARAQHLIWVTQVDGVWKVRKILDYDEGMTIPW